MTQQGTFLVRHRAWLMRRLAKKPRKELTREKQAMWLDLGGAKQFNALR